MPPDADNQVSEQHAGDSSREQLEQQAPDRPRTREALTQLPATDIVNPAEEHSDVTLAASNAGVARHPAPRRSKAQRARAAALASKASKDMQRLVASTLNGCGQVRIFLGQA